jgi:hypothetical protein
MPQRIKDVEDAMCSFTELGHNQRREKTENISSNPVPISSIDGKCTAENVSSTNQMLRDRNGKNSLAQLCRRFLMVLLCNPVSFASKKVFRP